MTPTLLVGVRLQGIFAGCRIALAICGPSVDTLVQQAAALVLHDAGLTVREIGPLLHVSHQRAHQLVAAAR